MAWVGKHLDLACIGGRVMRRGVGPETLWHTDDLSDVYSHSTPDFATE